jgi:uncharacterized membrane protein
MNVFIHFQHSFLSNAKNLVKKRSLRTCGGINLSKIAILLILIITSSTISSVHGQDEIVPISLELKIYTDGSVLVEYTLECDPSKLRLDVTLFGETFNNLIIQNEEERPLGFTKTHSGVTVDSIGASKLKIVYSSLDLTSKDGPIWDLNVTSPIETKITLTSGAAIFGLSDIPSDIGNIDGAQYVVLPAGDVYVSFILALSKQSMNAQSVIDETELHINSLVNQGYILTEAQSELTQAKTFFNSNNYADAKELAIKAKETADKIVDDAESAEIEIELAQIAINQAQSDGRTNGLQQAEETQSTAKNYYAQGRYLEAGSMANQASQLALNADKPSLGNTFIYLGLLLIAIAAGYYYTSKKGARIPFDTEKRAINLDIIFSRHETLRLEDKEVIKFLAGNNGEAFATEIRARFEMPRSSTWRLIRRLKNMEIIEETKIGNQSLIRIREEYRV